MINRNPSLAYDRQDPWLKSTAGDEDSAGHARGSPHTPAQLVAIKRPRRAAEPTSLLSSASRGGRHPLRGGGRCDAAGSIILSH